MAAFGAAASKAVGDYAQGQLNDAKALRDAAVKETDPDKRADMLASAQTIENNWGESGTYRVAAHTVVGGISGGLEGALGAGASAALSSSIDKLVDGAGLPDPIKQAVGAALASAAGALVGGGTGAGAAFNEDVNNRQLHEDGKAKEKTLAKKLAEESSGKYTQAQIEDALRSANNNKLGETASTGAVVPYDAKTNFTIYDKTGMMLGKASDGSPVLMQNPAMLATPPSDLQSYIKNNTGNTYSWNTAAPQLSGIPLFALPPIMNGSGRPPDYLSLQGNFYIASGGIAINLHDGEIFGQWSLGRSYPGYSATPGASLAFGKIIGGANATSTSDFLKGGGGSASYFYPLPVAPLIGAGGGINHSYGGSTSVEAGVSIPPGAAVNPVSYGFDFNKNSSKIDGNRK